MKLRKISAQIFVLLVVGVFTLNSCDKNQQCRRIETGPVDITIYPNSTEYQDLSVVNGWLYLTGRAPSMGIIVFRNSQNSFKAYERTSPANPNNPDARLVVDEETEMFAYDSISDTRYLLTDGYPFGGNESCPLTEYYTSYDGFKLRIFY